METAENVRFANETKVILNVTLLVSSEYKKTAAGFNSSHEHKLRLEIKFWKGELELL